MDGMKMPKRSSMKRLMNKAGTPDTAVGSASEEGSRLYKSMSRVRPSTMGKPGHVNLPGRIVKRNFSPKTAGHRSGRRS